MVDTSKLSKYLKPESVRDGDIIVFVDGGVILQKEFKDKNGMMEKKPVLEITVDYRGDNKTYTPNGTTIKILNKAWGANTDTWIGKQARLNILPSSNGKDMIVAKPVGGAVSEPADMQFNN